MKQALFVCTLFCFSISAFAALPKYGKPEILVRTNGLSTYNLPKMTFLSNATPVINNNGDVAFKLMAIEGENVQGLWFKASNEATGKIAYRAPMEMIMSDPSINDLGQAAFAVFDEGTSEGIFVYDSKNDQTQHVLKNDNKDIVAHVYPSILNSGDIYFRATHTTEDHSLFYFSSSLHKVFSEGEDTLGFKASYLFGPSINNQKQAALKIRLGNKKEWDSSHPDQILLVNSNGSHRIVAKDQKSDPNSLYTGFANSVSLSENGLVAFVGFLASGQKTLVIDENGVQSSVATEGLEEISEIELFSPKINSQGVVLFRAKNSQGQRGLYLADRTQVQRVLGENDEIPTDLGMGRIWSDKVYAAFAGGVNINDHNELTFHTLLVSAESGAEWGSAIYKLRPLF